MGYIPEQKYKSIFKTYLIYFISMVCFCLVRILASEGWMNVGNAYVSDAFYTILIQVGLMFLLPLFLYCNTINVKPKQVFKTCNFEKTNWRVIIISFAIGIIVFVINIIVSTLFNGLITSTGYQTPIIMAESVTTNASIWAFLFDVIFVAVLPGFCEEFMHRGILLQGTKHMGFTRSIIISGIMFGLIHFNINQVSYAIVLGIIIGFVSVVAKNIWPAIIIHFTNNFISVYLDYANLNGWPLGNFYEWFNTALQKLSMVTIFIIIAVVLIVVVLLLLWLIVLLFKQSILRKVNKAIEKVYSSEDYEVQNSPVIVDKSQMISEMLSSNTMLNLDYEEMKNPLQVVMPKQKQIYKTTFKDNLFLFASMFLGVVITIFTFVWGFI